MKTKFTLENVKKQVIEYLTDAASHSGYKWDGLAIRPGTAVVSLKTIAGELGISYYRVKKCITALVESGDITVGRHKCLAVISVNPQSPVEDMPRTDNTAESTTSGVTIRTGSAEKPRQLHLNRAMRRRLAREAAKSGRNINYFPAPVYSFKMNHSAEIPRDAAR